MAFTVTGYWGDSCDLSTINQASLGGLRLDGVSVSAAAPNSGYSARRGTTSLAIYTSTHLYSKTLVAAQDWTLNFAYINDTVTTANIIAALYDGSTAQVDIRTNTSGNIVATRNGTALGTSSNTLTNNTIFAIEVLVHIATGTNGWVDVNVNGTNWLRVTGANTDNAATGQATKFYLAPTTSAVTRYYEDIFIRCGSGLSTSDTLSDVGVQALRPTSDSTGANWTYSTGSTHYGVVDDTTVSETDYDSSSTVGAEQALGFGDLASTNYTIVGPVQFSVWAKKDDVGTRMMKLYCVSNGTTSYTSAMPVFDNGTYLVGTWPLNPDGNVAWTASAVNAATFGYRLDS